jgi:3-oxoacyl-[acyl-carrier protein] reductase
MLIKDKLIAITGAAGGLGQATARYLAARGCKLALLDINSQSLAALSQECRALGAQASYYTLDVTDEQQVNQTFNILVKDFGPLAGLVNNAGVLRDGLLINKREPMSWLAMDQWQAVIDTNLTGVFLCGRASAKQLIIQGQGGVIINISSIARAGNRGQTNYAAAKAGVAAMTVTWAQELASEGIRVAALAPGLVATPMTQAIKPHIMAKLMQRIPLGRLATGEEIAHSIGYILENDYFTGRVLEVDGGARF